MTNPSSIQHLGSDTRAFKEQERLQALDALKILGTSPEAAFDDLVWLASHACNAPISLISLVGAEYLWFKARHGFGLECLPRKDGFCEYAIEQDDLLEVQDARQDARFAHFTSVTGEPHLRFYAGMPLCGSDGHRYGTLCILDTQPRTLTEVQRESLRRLARRATDALETRKNYLLAQSQKDAMAQLLDLLPDAVVTCDESGILKEFNAVARDWHGVDPRAYEQHEWATHFGLYDEKGKDLLPGSQVPLARAWRGEKVRGQTMVIRTLNKPPRTVNCNANPVLSDDNKVLGAICSMHDITVQIRFGEMMEKLALTDALTGLPNRAAWFAELDRVMAHAKRHGCAVSVLFIDLNGFKQINDKLGHAAGDDLLRQFSSRLKANCRASDFIARLSGDEFVICLDTPGNETIEPERVSQQIHAAMMTPMLVDGREITIGCSIGTSVQEGPIFDADRLMDNADKAMYKVKRALKSSPSI